MKLSNIVVLIFSAKLLQKKAVHMSFENMFFNRNEKKVAVMVIQCPEKLMAFKSKAADIRYRWRFL